MPFRDPRRHLEDVLDAINKIDEFIGAIDLNAYRADDKTKATVERKIQVLTEAIIRLDDESPGAYPEIDQKGYRGMGNILPSPNIHLRLGHPRRRTSAKIYRLQ